MDKKTAVRRVGRSLMLLLVMASGFFMAPGVGVAASDSAVIFMYHRVGDSRFPSTNIRMDQFREHLAYLDDHGFRVAPLGEVVAALKRGDALPDKTVVITMDDAYASVYENAWPLLKAKGWPFTVFVATDVVDKGFKGFMTWDQMREMAKDGVQFANHSASHPHMIHGAPGETDAQRLDRVKADVLKGQARLQAELGEAPMLLAYPYGEYDAKVAELVSGLGYTAFGQHSGAVGHYTDWRAVPRFPLSEAYGTLSAFQTKARARAFPVVEMSPWDPVTDERRPELEVALAPGDALWDELSCYVSGQGRVDIEWLVPAERFKVRAKEDLGPGRHKYNLTVPDKTRRAYLWFSRQWVVRE